MTAKVDSDKFNHERLIQHAPWKNPSSLQSAIIPARGSDRKSVHDPDRSNASQHRLAGDLPRIGELQAGVGDRGQNQTHEIAVTNGKAQIDVPEYVLLWQEMRKTSTSVLDPSLTSAEILRFSEALYDFVKLKRASEKALRWKAKMLRRRLENIEVKVRERAVGTRVAK